MRTLLSRLLIVLAACSLAVMLHGAGSHADSSVKVEPIIWQLDRDYPDGTPNDNALPISTVYIKTHDGTDWMATYDTHPAAVTGPDAIRNLINLYGQQGIQVAAWFVPTGSDYDTQVQMAEQVIDSGVTALYADVEPFHGFCDQDCAALADNFWARLRSERPNARLGVIYDPRVWYWDSSATTHWFASADDVLPMCYWADFVGQVPYGDPEGCIAQAKSDLPQLAPGRTLGFIPILEGDSTPDLVQQAMDASVRAEATSISIWRRGVVSADVWNAIAIYQAPGGPHCALQLVDGCVVKEAFLPPTYVIDGGGKLLIQNPSDLAALGLTARDVQTLPAGALKKIPSAPRVPADGTLLTGGDGEIYVVYGGAKFPVPDGEFAPLGLDPSQVKALPPSVTAQLPLIPADYSRIQQLGDPIEYVVLHGARIPLDSDAIASLAAAGHGGEARYVVPTGALDQVPLAQIKRGDADCDGNVGLLDVILVLQRSVGLASPGVCLHVAGDVTCDGWPSPPDALAILRFVVGTPEKTVAGCPQVGVMEPAALPARDTAALSGSPTPASTATLDATATPNPTDAATATASGTPTPTATAGATPRATATALAP
jgi:hypothetical protein